MTNLWQVTPDSPRLRFDITTNDWVLFSPARSRRPQPRRASGVDQSPESIASCPFCPGREDPTCPEILRLDAAGSSAGWSVRVVPNKFPALDHTALPETSELGPVFREMGGYGAHEIVIESPEHSRSLADQPLEQIDRVLTAIHRRFLSLMHDRRLRSIVVFKNHGRRAGTSLSHPHWQIVATPVVPHQLRLKHSIATDYYDKTSRCLYSVALQQELSAGQRVLIQNDDYVAVAPFASHAPYQIRILPREHQASFANVDPSRLRTLSDVLKNTLVRLNRLLGDPHFNLTLGTAPIGDEDERYFLWHIDVIPRLATPAGFELGSGMSINPVLPEQAVSELLNVPE